jgi:hypothetical protein
VIEAPPSGTVYMLAARARLAEVREAVMPGITAGKPVSTVEIEHRIAEAKALRKKAENEAAIQASRQAAQKTATFLRERLGSNFERFRSMLTELPWCEVEQAIRELATVNTPDDLIFLEIIDDGTITDKDC